MKTIIRDRESGKARELIAFAVKNDATIIAENPEAFEVKAHNYGYNNVKVMSWADFIVYNYSIEGDIVIHNMDKMMKWFSGNKLIGFSATLEEDE